MGRASRAKGLRIEREVVELFRSCGIYAERVPLSGASRYQDNGADVDVYMVGRDEAPMVAEVKARRDGSGFAQLERWLGDADMLVLRRDRARPMVTLPWMSVERLARAMKELEEWRSGRRKLNGPRLAAISEKPEVRDENRKAHLRAVRAGGQ